MSAPVATRPAPTGRMVRSESRPGVWYEVTLEHCPCESFRFGHARDAAFRCKHQLAEFPLPVPSSADYCIVCPGPALSNSLYCRDCQDARYAREMAAVNAAAPAPEPCRYCGQGPDVATLGMCADCHAIEVADAAAEPLPDTTPEANAESAAIWRDIMLDVRAGRWAPVVTADLVADRARTAALLASGANWMEG